MNKTNTIKMKAADLPIIVLFIWFLGSKDKVDANLELER